jgi:DNA-binding transcriptional LysR family regulator
MEEAHPVAPNDSVVNPVRLAVFCAVVEHAGFARAAEALTLTPAAVSMHIGTLDQLCGVSLFDREHRDGRLTEAGHPVYDFAVGVLQANAAVHVGLNDLLGARAGTMTMPTPIHWSWRLASGRVSLMSARLAFR